MKAVRLREATCRNPEYDRRKNAQRVKDGLTSIPRTLKCPAGEIIDSPDGALLCLGSNPPLAPADEECRLAVLRLLNNPSRREQMIRLRLMYEKRSQLTKEGREYVEKVFEKHEDEINEDSPANQVVTKTKTTKSADPVTSKTAS